VAGASTDAHGILAGDGTAMEVDADTDALLTSPPPSPAALHTATMRAKEAVEAADRANMPDDVKQCLRREFERRRTAEIAAQPLAQRRKLALVRVEVAATGVAKYREATKQATIALEKWNAEAALATEALQTVDQELADAAAQPHWAQPPHPAELAAQAALQSNTALRHGLGGMLHALKACNGAPGPPDVALLTALAQSMAAAEALFSEPVPAPAPASPPAENADSAPRSPAGKEPSSPDSVGSLDHENYQYKAPAGAATKANVEPAAEPVPTQDAAAAAMAASEAFAAAGAAAAGLAAAPLSPTQLYVPQGPRSSVAPNQGARERSRDRSRDRSRSPRSAAEIAAAASQEAALAEALRPRGDPGENANAADAAATAAATATAAESQAAAAAAAASAEAAAAQAAATAKPAGQAAAGSSTNPAADQEAADNID
jgi:hypothetical protein